MNTHLRNKHTPRKLDRHVSSVIKHADENFFWRANLSEKYLYYLNMYKTYMNGFEKSFQNLLLLYTYKKSIENFRFVESK